MNFSERFLNKTKNLPDKKNMQRILIIDDSPEILTIVEALFSKKYRVRCADTLAQAKTWLAKEPFDMVLLDLNLPDGSGLGLLAELVAIPSQTHQPSVFLLTSCHEDQDKLQAFQLGAEDYITKPFSHNELRARVDARMRRMVSSQTNGLRKGGLYLCIPTQRATITDHAGIELHIDLSSLEFKLLHYFMRHGDHVLSRQQIMDSVWGNHVQVLDRTVDAHVSRLRKKLIGSDYNVTTVVGTGYSFRRLTNAESFQSI